MKVKCPRCGNETTFENNPYRPFCSERCKLVDLGSWISEKYSIPNPEPQEEDGSPKVPEESPEE
jgi:uncharacterized protein